MSTIEPRHDPRFQANMSTREPRQDPRFQAIFSRCLEDYVLQDDELADMRAVTLMLFQQTLRPALRSDVLGAGYTCLSFFENLYARVLSTAYAEFQATASDAERPDAGEDSNSGGVPR